jgi:rSAM/selenodomain-associated transferase 1
MARSPRPGTVKTRLAARLGAQAACDLYRAFILDLHARLAATGHPQFWFHWPEDPGFGALVPGAAAVTPQHGDDLGERMANAFAAVFAAGFAPVVMLGADVPHVPLAWVRDAIARVEQDADIALGPADDGGYYLIALRELLPELFRDIVWGTDSVARATYERAAAAGLRLARLPPWYDIDEVADLTRLAGAIARHPDEPLVHTRAALIAAGLSPA